MLWGGTEDMDKLLHMLEDGRFHSGEALGQALGLTRTSVWKRLHQLEDQGIALQRVPGKGYRLARPLSLLKPELITPTLQQLGWHLHLYDQLDSTNRQCLRMLQSSENTLPLVVLAEEQTQGRGRRGRLWVSPPAENIYFSLALQVVGSQLLTGLSLTVGLAVLRTLQKAGVAEVGLKWPNDIYVRGKHKIAGILLELSGDPNDFCQVVIGIGINANMDGGLGIDQPWSSVSQETGKVINRSELASQLAWQLAYYLQRHQEEGFSVLRAEWEANHIWQGLTCILEQPTKRIQGKILGIGPEGSLRMDVVGQGELNFFAGDLSLRVKHDS